MGVLHTWPRHPLSSVDHGCYFNFHVLTTGSQPNRDCDCGYLAQYNQAYSRPVWLIGLGRLTTEERGTPIISPWVGKTNQPCLAIHLGEGNSEFKLMVRGICWHCPSLLVHGSCISCYFPSMGAQFWLSGCGVPAF